MRLKNLQKNDSAMNQLIKSSQNHVDSLFQSNLFFSLMVKNYNTSVIHYVQMNLSKKVSNQLKSMLLLLAVFVAGSGSVWGQNFTDNAGNYSCASAIAK